MVQVRFFFCDMFICQG